MCTQMFTPTRGQVALSPLYRHCSLLTSVSAHIHAQIFQRHPQMFSFSSQEVWEEWAALSEKVIHTESTAYPSIYKSHNIAVHWLKCNMTVAKCVWRKASVVRNRCRLAWMIWRKLVSTLSRICANSEGRPYVGRGLLFDKDIPVLEWQGLDA